MAIEDRIETADGRDDVGGGTRHPFAFEQFRVVGPSTVGKRLRVERQVDLHGAPGFRLGSEVLVPIGLVAGREVGPAVTPHRKRDDRNVQLLVPNERPLQQFSESSMADAAVDGLDAGGETCGGWFD